MAVTTLTDKVIKDLLHEFQVQRLKAELQARFAPAHMQSSPDWWGSQARGLEQFLVPQEAVPYRWSEPPLEVSPAQWVEPQPVAPSEKKSKTKS